MQNLIQDLRYAARVLWRKPGFTIVVVLTLALGIGANTAIFSMIYNMLLRPLPVHDRETLALVRSTNLERGIAEAQLSLPDFLDLKEQNQVFSELTAVSSAAYNLAGPREALYVSGMSGTANLFRLLGVEPSLGRGFLPGEDEPGAGRVVVISHALWQRNFGGGPGIVGQTCRLDGETYTIVGVMPAEFWFPSREVALWTPLTIDLSQTTRDERHFTVFGRLKSGVTHETASMEMDGLASRLAQQYPATNTGWSVRVANLLDLNTETVVALALLIATVGFVLLIACANVASLLLARAASRQKEIAIRSALGAGRGRLLRQLLTESVVLALLGGVAGFLLAIWGINLLEAASQGTHPLLENIPVDWRAFAYALALGAGSSVLFGLAPAVRGSRPDVTETLKEAGRRSSGAGRVRLGRLLVVVQVSLAFTLLIVSALLLTGLAAASRVDPGFDPDNLLALNVSLTPSEYPEEAQVSEYYRKVLERIETLPGVETTGAVSQIPTTGSRFNPMFTITVEGRPPASPNDTPTAARLTVSPGYFNTIGIPLLRGENLMDQNTSETPLVAVVSRTMAARYWPEEEVVGKRFKFGLADAASPWIIVKGVVGDVRNDDFDAPPLPQVYLPHAQEPQHRMSVLVRAASDPLELASVVQNEIRAVDANQPVFNVKTMNQILYEDMQGSYIIFGMIGVFGSLALLLAAGGLYGVISYVVSQRTHEIGVRMALGARSGDILRLVLREGLTLAGIGAAIGIAGSLALTQLMTSLLFGVSPTDPATFGGVSLLLGVVALLASIVPARRASRVDPMVALRYE